MLRTEQLLEECARTLAARFAINARYRSGDRAASNLDDHARFLRNAYMALTDDVQKGRFVTQASEWILDNYQLMASTITEVHENLPRDYLRDLPKLAVGVEPGEARIYAVAGEIIRHSDHRVDPEQLVRFLNAFQSVAPLTSDEQWAWPSVLRWALIEGIRLLAEEVLIARAARRAGDEYVKCCAAAHHWPPRPIPADAQDGYVVQVLEWLREHGPRLSAVRSAIAAHLAARGITAEDAIRREHLHEAAGQVSMGNAISSLRLCASLDWSLYFEGVSLIDRVLRRDPAGVYEGMDFLRLASIIGSASCLRR